MLVNVSIDDDFHYIMDVLEDVEEIEEDINNDFIEVSIFHR